MSLPELLTVAVASVVVLGAILLALETTQTVAARTESRFDDLATANLAAQRLQREASGAYLVAPVDPLAPGAAVDGVSLLVQAGTAPAGGRDPRVWVTYRCATTAGARGCTRAVYAAESAVVDPSGLPRLLQDAGGRYLRGGQLGATETFVTGLATGAGATPVFSLGWPQDAEGAACTTADCVGWRGPSGAPAGTLGGRAVWRRSARDARPPIVRATFQVRTGRSPRPVGISTALGLRGCIDPTPQAETAGTTQVDC